MRTARSNCGWWWLGSQWAQWKGQHDATVRIQHNSEGAEFATTITYQNKADTLPNPAMYSPKK